MAINQHVISDLQIKESDLTYDEFVDRMVYQGPAGYDDWRVLITGDKEYQKAAIMSVVRTNGSSVPQLTQLELTVDVPDVFDRGTGTSSAAGVVTVPFNRPFYAPPEVTASIKGGSTIGVINISNVTATGFDFDVRNTSNARIGSITISWAARGY